MTQSHGEIIPPRSHPLPPRSVELCSIRVGPTLFGIPSTDILEIIGNANPQPVALAPAFIAGMVPYHGDVLTVVTLRQLLGMSGFKGPHAILVLESENGCFGLLVDSVNGIFPVSDADYEPNPSTLDLRRQSLFDGAYKLDHGLLVMLNRGQLEPLQLCEAPI